MKVIFTSIAHYHPNHHQFIEQATKSKSWSRWDSPNTERKNEMKIKDNRYAFSQADFNLPCFFRYINMSLKSTLFILFAALYILKGLQSQTFLHF